MLGEVGIGSYSGTLGVLSELADPGTGTGAGRVLLGENILGGGTEALGASTGEVNSGTAIEAGGVSSRKANVATGSAAKGA